MDQPRNARCPVCLETCPQRPVERIRGYRILECSACTVQHCVSVGREPDDGPTDRAFYRRRLELVGSYLGWDHRFFLAQNLERGCRLLEIGCGTGDFIHYAGRAGYRAVGVDVDEAAVLAGRRYWKTQDIWPLSAEAYFLQRGDARFKIICLFAVLEHLRDPHALMELVSEHLDSDGYLFLSTPNKDSVLNRVWGITTRADYPPHHRLRWSKKALGVFLSLHGLEMVGRQTCTPTLTDIIPDLFRLYGPSSLKTRTVQVLSALMARALSPVDLLARRMAREGRSQLIVARPKQRRK